MSSTLHMTETIKCPLCSHSWDSLELFLGDRDVALLGYQVHFREDTTGFFLFNHLTCRTTLGVKAKKFLSLSEVPIQGECHRHEDRCPEYCLRTSLSQNPPPLCDCTFVKSIVDVIQGWPKHA